MLIVELFRGVYEGVLEWRVLADAIKQELKHFQDHFNKYGSVLEMEEKAKEVLIQRALQEGTGMRAIKTLLTQVIHLLRFDIEEWRGFVCDYARHFKWQGGDKTPIELS